MVILGMGGSFHCLRLHTEAREEVQNETGLMKKAPGGSGGFQVFQLQGPKALGVDLGDAAIQQGVVACGANQVGLGQAFQAVAEVERAEQHGGNRTIVGRIRVS